MAHEPAAFLRDAQGLGPVANVPDAAVSSGASWGTMPAASSAVLAVMISTASVGRR